MKQEKIERMKARGTYQDNRDYKAKYTYSKFDPIVAYNKKTGKPITQSKWQGEPIGAIETSKNRE